MAEEFTAEVQDDYIILRNSGEVTLENEDKPVTNAVDLAKEHDIHKLLDDIREIDVQSVSVPVQAKAIGLMWKLREFKKIAILTNDEEIDRVVRSTLDSVPFNTRAKAFNNEEEAIAWLKQE